MAAVTPNEALELILAQSRTIGTKKLRIDQSHTYGYVLAQDIFADRDTPPFNRAAVDGYAVRLSDLESGMREFTVIGELRAGSGETFEIKEGETLFIMTGAPVPPTSDLLIRLENVERSGDKAVLKDGKFKKHLNIALQGEDARAGDILVRNGAPVDCTTIPLIASAGVVEVDVYDKPKVHLVSTGDEVVPAEDTPLPHQIRDTSSYGLRSLMGYTGVPLASGVRVKDTEEDFRRAFEEGLKGDVLMVTGGVSAGVTDRVPAILESLGVKKVFHKIAIKPGKPVYFGVAENGCLVFGLPGNPVSTLVSYKRFVEPAIYAISGREIPQPYYFPLGDAKDKRTDLEECMQGTLVHDRGQTVIIPMSHHGSGDFVNVRYSSGIFIHPADREEMEAGENVAFFPWRNMR